MNNFTVDQKLKAFEIASQLFTTKEKEADESQEAFTKYMDEYFSMVAGLATIILRNVASMQT